MEDGERREGERTKKEGKRIGNSERLPFFFPLSPTLKNDASNCFSLCFAPRQAKRLYYHSREHHDLSHASLSALPSTWRGDDPRARGSAPESVRVDVVVADISSSPLFFAADAVAFHRRRFGVRLPLESRFVGLGLCKPVS